MSCENFFGFGDDDDDRGWDKKMKEEENGKDKTRSRQFCNDRDPITLEDVDENDKYLFIHSTEDEKWYAFDSIALANYFASLEENGRDQQSQSDPSKNKNNPFTRKQFTTQEIAQVYSLAHEKENHLRKQAEEQQKQAEEQQKQAEEQQKREKNEREKNENDIMMNHKKRKINPLNNTSIFENEEVAPTLTGDPNDDEQTNFADNDNVNEKLYDEDSDPLSLKKEEEEDKDDSWSTTSDDQNENRNNHLDPQMKKTMIDYLENGLLKHCSDILFLAEHTPEFYENNKNNEVLHASACVWVTVHEIIPDLVDKLYEIISLDPALSKKSIQQCFSYLRGDSRRPNLSNPLYNSDFLTQIIQFFSYVTKYATIKATERPMLF